MQYPCQHKTVRLYQINKNAISPHSRKNASLNKPKPSTAETNLLVSIVEVPVYAMQSQYEALVAHATSSGIKEKGAILNRFPESGV